MPEMKGRTLEELDELFLNRVSVRNFKKFQCTVRRDAAHDVQKRLETENGNEEDATVAEVKDGAATHAEEVEGEKRS